MYFVIFSIQLLLHLSPVFSHLVFPFVAVVVWWILTSLFFLHIYSPFLCCVLYLCDAMQMQIPLTTMLIKTLEMKMSLMQLSRKENCVSYRIFFFMVQSESKMCKNCYKLLYSNRLSILHTYYAEKKTVLESYFIFLKK